MSDEVGHSQYMIAPKPPTARMAALRKVSIGPTTLSSLDHSSPAGAHDGSLFVMI